MNRRKSIVTKLLQLRSMQLRGAHAKGRVSLLSDLPCEKVSRPSEIANLQKRMAHPPAFQAACNEYAGYIADFSAVYQTGLRARVPLDLPAVFVGSGESICLPRHPTAPGPGYLLPYLRNRHLLLSTVQFIHHKYLNAPAQVGYAFPGMTGLWSLARNIATSETSSKII
jgi:hypothetical protein